jgi:hypothetical protein
MRGTASFGMPFLLHMMDDRGPVPAHRSVTTGEQAPLRSRPDLASITWSIDAECSWNSIGNLHHGLSMRTVQQHAFWILAVASFLSAACGSTPAEGGRGTAGASDRTGTKTGAEIRSSPVVELERTTILKNLRSLLDRIDERLSGTNAQLSSRLVTASERRRYDAMKTELSEERTMVETMIDTAEATTDATWGTTKDKLAKGTREVNSRWSRFRDNIEQPIDTDHGEDGH